MKRSKKALFAALSFTTIALGGFLQRASAAHPWPCHACVQDCALITQELACDLQCNDMEVAHPHQCFDDEYEYCDHWTLIVECAELEPN